MKIKIFAGMRKYFQGTDEIVYDPGQGVSVARLLEEIGLEKSIKCVVVKDGRALEPEAVVYDSDSLSLVRFVAGG